MTRMTADGADVGASPVDVINSNSKTVAIEFSGRKMEYTRLWLVNTLLTIITLGIYSAWAKVRNTQYLYGHTQIDGHRLRFLATPLQILRGRIIAVILFGLYVGINSLNPKVGIIATLMLFIAMPWLVIQGLKFSLRMTAYRNVRFSYTATYFKTLGYFFLLPLLGIFSFGLLMPWVAQRVQKFMLENITYGGKAFTLNSRAGHYYLVALNVIVIAFLAMMAIALIAALSGMGAGALAGLAAGAEKSNGLAALAGILPVYIIGIFFANYLIAAVMEGMIRNHIMENLKVDDVMTFRSDIGIMSFALLNFSNALLVIFTLGLGYPATQIRKKAFLAKATQVTLEPQIETLVNTVSDQDSAIGEEVAGLFDADLSLT